MSFEEDLVEAMVRPLCRCWACERFASFPGLPGMMPSIAWAAACESRNPLHKEEEAV